MQEEYLTESYRSSQRLNQPHIILYSLKVTEGFQMMPQWGARDENAELERERKRKEAKNK